MHQPALGVMRAHLKLWIGRIWSSFWFVPLAMLALTPGLSVLLLILDRAFDPGLQATLPWAYAGGAVGARSLLTTIAGAMITAASVTFSLASVALSIASQQYGSRVLRNFMRDRITQILLGTFLSTFLFSVLLVWDIRGSSASNAFVPAISVTVAIALAVISLILLIFFVHHISISIKASHQLLLIANDLNARTRQLYPGIEEQGTGGASALERGHPVNDLLCRKTGYLQNVDIKSLVSVAARKNLTLELCVKPGDYCLAKSTLARVFGALDRETAEDMVGGFVIGGERTPEQDVRYQFLQIAEIIIRSMSPAINDPFIARTGIDELANAVDCLTRCPRPSESIHDEHGVVRLSAPVPQVVEILESTVGHILVYASADPFVVEALEQVLDATHTHGPWEASAVERLRGRIRETLQHRRQKRA